MHFISIIPSNKKYIFSERSNHRLSQKLLFSDREDEKCRIPGRKKQTLNRHYLAKIKSCTTQFLEAQKCKIFGESLLTVYIYRLKHWLSVSFRQALSMPFSLLSKKLFCMLAQQIIGINKNASSKFTQSNPQSFGSLYWISFVGQPGH